MLEHWAANQPDAPALVYEARIWPLPGLLRWQLCPKNVCVVLP